MKKIILVLVMFFLLVTVPAYCASDISAGKFTLNFTIAVLAAVTIVVIWHIAGNKKRRLRMEKGGWKAEVKENLKALDRLEARYYIDGAVAKYQLEIANIEELDDGSTERLQRSSTAYRRLNEKIIKVVEDPGAVLICKVYDPLTGQPLTDDVVELEIDSAKGHKFFVTVNGATRDLYMKSHGKSFKHNPINRGFSYKIRKGVGPVEVHNYYHEIYTDLSLVDYLETLCLVALSYDNNAMTDMQTSLKVEGEEPKEEPILPVESVEKQDAEEDKDELSGAVGFETKVDTREETPPAPETPESLPESPSEPESPNGSSSSE